MNGEKCSVFEPFILVKLIDLVKSSRALRNQVNSDWVKIHELTNQCIVALFSGGVQCRSIPLKTIKVRFKSQILHSVLVLHNNYNMANNLDLRLGQLVEQGKTMADATRRLLETVNAVEDTGELLLQMIENHQKMLEMNQRVENLINDVKTVVKVETISYKEEDWGDNSPPTPQPSEDWDVEADDMPFYIPVRRTITVEQWEMRCPACGGRPSRCPCS